MSKIRVENGETCSRDLVSFTVPVCPGAQSPATNPRNILYLQSHFYASTHITIHPSQPTYKIINKSHSIKYSRDSPSLASPRHLPDQGIKYFKALAPPQNHQHKSPPAIHVRISFPIPSSPDRVKSKPDRQKEPLFIHKYSPNIMFHDALAESSSERTE
ncbi:uncharacterized protein BDR25DRAFT_350086 [Lindgomyces ingoldianus]|uniref:Uncharacterized protein n=1 Tax=Lindgomyces ingoldianus TaxID=673940 RepID=A0ACB6R909_9PLEO|nr:uncharacterized protein BDR25DRAFT_350086 [Lindgomyces ingoldianus]KAF2475803.1 hypothetical protein BDR25DRAFT_350086 [Lindgomyces ingoldianus]